MTHLLGQLTRWRFTERLIRLAWGGARLVAIVGAALAVSCLVDWAADRYLGSETWRKFLKATWVFAPGPAPTAEERWFTEHLRVNHGFRVPPPAVIDDTPKWMRLGMTGGQVALALGLTYLLLVRPWRRTPPVDELASEAEKAIPAFGHRLVTAVQLNRPTARTQGMSQTLIAEVTREAGEMAEEHNLLRLIDYRRLLFAVLVLVPVLGGWAAYAVAKPELAKVLVQRQMLANVEIPRTIQLRNVSQEVWPTGAEVKIEYRVTGDYPRPWFTERLRAEHRYALPRTGEGFAGRLRVEPDGQPEESYDLVFEKEDGDGALFATKLPAASLDFSFTARLDNGRTREAGRVRFEGPPQLAAGDNAITAEQYLPPWLGKRPDGGPFVRKNDGWTRGDVIDALPNSNVVVRAKFNKPVAKARLVPIVRDGVREKDFPDTPAKFHEPDEVAADRLSAVWEFPTAAKMIAYRIELTDDRGFVNGVPIRRNVRMVEDRPPVVAFMAESTRHPDPQDYEGKVDTESKAALEWGDKMPLAEGGRMMVIYHARSDQGVSRANVAYRVIPKGVPPDAYPRELQDIQHPRQDPENKLFTRLPLKPVTADLKTVGPYVPDLGLFERSWQGLSKLDRFRVNVEFYSFPSPAPDAEPPALEAGGRYMFEIDGLEKKVPDSSTGKFTTAKLEVGDTVELFVEVFDKNPAPGRAPGYTKEARRKIVVSGEDALAAIKMRDEQNKRLQDKLRDLAADQANVFRQTVTPPKKDEKEKP